MDGPAPPPAADRRRILQATGAAFAVAFVVLVMAVLPAEYAIDPTGFGAWSGLVSLNAVPDAPDGASDAAIPDPALSTSGGSVTGFTSAWPLATADVATLDGYATEGGTENLTVPIGLANVTRVTATLTWDDANVTAGQPTKPDLFQLVVEAPDGRLGEARLGRNVPGAAGSVTATFDWSPVPATLEAEMETEAQARAEFARIQPADGSAVGDWRIRVTLLEAGDGSVNGVDLPEGAGPTADEGNTWSLTVRAATYSLDVETRPGLGERKDTVTFTLKPGEALEYKLGIAENATLDYRWSTNGPPVYYDFHGDQEGASGFARHKAATSSADAGTLKAPFDGRHGWYWENKGTETATLTLVTRGAYTVIGKV